MLKPVDGKRQLSVVTGPAAIKYKLVFQLAFGCRSSAASVFGGFRRWTASVNFRQLPGRRLLDFGSHRTASAAAFGGIDSER